MKNFYFLAIALIVFSWSGKAQNTAAAVKYGKYGCTASKYTGGSYEYTPKGSFTLKKDGTYTYEGFQKPSKGIFTVDAKGRITATGSAVTITPAWSSITSKPTTLSGYGITDAIKKNAVTWADLNTTASVGVNESGE